MIKKHLCLISFLVVWILFHLIYVPSVFAMVWYKAYLEAQMALEQERWEDAIKYFQEAITDNPSSEEDKRAYGTHFIDYYPYLKLGQSYLAIGNLGLAYRYCKKSKDIGVAPKHEVDKCLSYFPEADAIPEKDRETTEVSNQKKPLLPQYEKILFEGHIPDEIIEGETVNINGQKVRVNRVNKEETSVQIQYLGESENITQEGLNIIDTIEKKLFFWKEMMKLKRFSDPYPNSQAILIAIDDYRRLNDPQRRGSTGFDALKYMVYQAERLRASLQKVGFPAQNIQTFYDEEAISHNIEEALKSFWKGGDLEPTDRLFFYFGGHGTTHDNKGYLVTYDYDPDKPALTSIAMEDLTNRYAREITAHHMIIALDACHSGLALYKTLDQELDGEKLKKLRTLSVIRSNTEPKARNVLLAGTEEQPALYDEGGIFTKSLIKGLEGEADLNDDNLIQFEELAFYVRNEVIIKAFEKGKRQEPEYYILDRFGNGRVVFIFPQLMKER